ncbi:hypothetical protein PM082_011038 [Marasmius tenuissimus]|nr:hypothetical protein PM082_011038 [Marasmius tenuissimus]
MTIAYTLPTLDAFELSANNLAELYEIQTSLLNTSNPPTTKPQSHHSLDNLSAVCLMNEAPRPPGSSTLPLHPFIAGSYVASTSTQLHSPQPIANDSANQPTPSVTFYTDPLALCSMSRSPIEFCLMMKGLDLEHYRLPSTMFQSPCRNRSNTAVCQEQHDLRFPFRSGTDVDEL